MHHASCGAVGHSGLRDVLSEVGRGTAGRAGRPTSHLQNCSYGASGGHLDAEDKISGTSETRAPLSPADAGLECGLRTKPDIVANCCLCEPSSSKGQAKECRLLLLRNFPVFQSCRSHNLRRDDSIQTKFKLHQFQPTLQPILQLPALIWLVSSDPTPTNPPIQQGNGRKTTDGGAETRWDVAANRDSPTHPL